MLLLSARAHRPSRARAVTDALLIAVPLALALILAALPIVLVTVTLAAKRPPGVARGFLGGWLLGILLVGGIVIALVDVLVLPSGNTSWFGSLKVVLGSLLILLGVTRWIGRRDAKPPGWLAAAESMSAGRALALGFALAAANPKNLVLVVAGATAIAEATPVPAQQAVAFVAFTLVGSLGVAAPVIVTVVLGDRADDVLTATDAWMTRHSATIVSLVLMGLGGLVVLNGIIALAG